MPNAGQRASVRPKGSVQGLQSVLHEHGTAEFLKKWTVTSATQLWPVGGEQQKPVLAIAAKAAGRGDRGQDQRRQGWRARRAVQPRTSPTQRGRSSCGQVGPRGGGDQERGRQGQDATMALNSEAVPEDQDRRPARPEDRVRRTTKDPPEGADDDTMIRGDAPRWWGTA